MENENAGSHNMLLQKIQWAWLVR